MTLSRPRPATVITAAIARAKWPVGLRGGAGNWRRCRRILNVPDALLPLRANQLGLPTAGIAAAYVLFNFNTTAKSG
jgi:hypothetical protein